MSTVSLASRVRVPKSVAAVGELAVLLQYVVDTAGPHGGVGDEAAVRCEGSLPTSAPRRPLPTGSALLDHRVVAGRCAGTTAAFVEPRPSASIGDVVGRIGGRGGGEGGQAAESGERADGGGEREHATAAGAGAAARGVRCAGRSRDYSIPADTVAGAVRRRGRRRRERGQGQRGTGGRADARVASPDRGRCDAGSPERNVDLVDVGRVARAAVEGDGVGARLQRRPAR